MFKKVEIKSPEEMESSVKEMSENGYYFYSMKSKGDGVECVFMKYE